MQDPVIMPQRALISVSDKTGIEGLAHILTKYGAEILSTGGTASALRKLGFDATEVSDHTGFPEILDGRVKTLVPQIHGGILGQKDNRIHKKQMQDHAIVPIDLVCVNLYPFEEKITANACLEECIENIDIGGPAMIRSAAKNFQDVIVLTSPSDYDEYITAVIEKGGTTLAFRRKLAAKAFARTAAYDSAVANWFARREKELFPERLSLSMTRHSVMRYGENPHQMGAFYLNDLETRAGLATSQQLQGKPMSYNNLNDADAAFELVEEFENPAVVIVKHANPCGTATGDTLDQAWDKALRCDPISAFGGIVAVNRTLDASTAKKLINLFLEVIIAPDIDKESAAILSKKKNIRVLLTGSLTAPVQGEPSVTVRSLAGGFLVQTRDDSKITRRDLKIVTRRQPTERELKDLIFATRVVKHVKSNAIVYAKDQATTGIGAGQMSRVDSARIATSKSQEAARIAGEDRSLAYNSVAASDAFFPFADGLQILIEAGITAVIQPGGSIKDDEVIAMADAAGVAMAFTGMRHFRH